jgi:hypothetical protein
MTNPSRNKNSKSSRPEIAALVSPSSSTSPLHQLRRPPNYMTNGSCCCAPDRRIPPFFPFVHQLLSYTCSLGPCPAPPVNGEIESKMNAIWTGINGEIERAALTSREGRRGRTPPVNLTRWITENCPDLYKWALAHDSGARYGIFIFQIFLLS